MSKTEGGANEEEEMLKAIELFVSNPQAILYHAGDQATESTKKLVEAIVARLHPLDAARVKASPFMAKDSIFVMAYEMATVRRPFELWDDAFPSVPLFAKGL